jgi:GxxExxY protein
VSAACAQGASGREKVLFWFQGIVMTENEIGRIVVDVAIAVHRALGPGLLETVYEAVLAYEFSKRGLAVKRQVGIPVVYEGLEFDEGFRADIIVEDKVILELKSVEKMILAHGKQIQTYLLLMNLSFPLSRKASSS